MAILVPGLYSLIGVATIVQGAIVQGDSCPRRQLSKGQLSKELLSKEIFVQVDSCPRRLLSKADFCPRRQLHVFLSKEELSLNQKKLIQLKKFQGHNNLWLHPNADPFNYFEQDFPLRWGPQYYGRFPPPWTGSP